MSSSVRSRSSIVFIELYLGVFDLAARSIAHFQRRTQKARQARRVGRAQGLLLLRRRYGKLRAFPRLADHDGCHDDSRGQPLMHHAISPTGIADWLTNWGYLGIFICVFVGNLGIPMPEETVLLAA